MVAVQQSSSTPSRSYADRLTHEFEEGLSRRRSIWSLTGSVAESMDEDHDGLQQQTDIQPEEGKEDASMKEESDEEGREDDWTLDAHDAAETKVAVPEHPEHSIAMALACMAE